MIPRSDRLYQQPWPDGSYRLLQLGFVVDDAVDAAGRWARTFGVGPFHVPPPNEVACTYRGTASAIDVRVAVAQAGPVQIELIEQRCDRPSIYRDMHAVGGPGFHQLCTVVADLDATKAHYARLGYELASELVAFGQRVAYYDTYAEFGFFTEIAEDVPGFLDQLDRIARTCAAWDGTDPVRLLTRDGYRTPS